MGYCALDRRRRPLTGAELRGCWTERPAAGSAAAYRAASPGTATVTGAPETGEPSHRLRLASRDFVPVELIVLERPEVVATTTEPDEPAAPFLAGEPADGWTGRTSLFGDAER